MLFPRDFDPEPICSTQTTEKNRNPAFNFLYFIMVLTAESSLLFYSPPPTPPIKQFKPSGLLVLSYILYNIICSTAFRTYQIYTYIWIYSKVGTLLCTKERNIKKYTVSVHDI